MIPKKAKLTFHALNEAAQEHRLVLTACKDIRTGKVVYVVAESVEIDGTISFNPLARLFPGNPHNEVTPVGMDAPKLM